MYWNNDLKLVGKNEPHNTEVYEVLSEAHITGIAKYFSGNLSIMPLINSEINNQDLHAYYIKAKYPIYDKAKYSIKNATEDGYYHQGSIVGELLSLLAIHYRARFYCLHTTSQPTDTRLPVRYSNNIVRFRVPKYWDKHAFGTKERNFSSFISFLDDIRKLPEDTHLRIMKAASNYNSALKQIGIDPEMVFVKLVSAIEALSGYFPLTEKEDPLLNINDLDCLSSEQKEAIRNCIENRKTMRKFINFIEHHSKGYFKGGRSKAPRLKIRKPELKNVLKAIYNARSEYLHNGESMYLSTPVEGFNWDKDGSLGIYIGQRKFTAKKQLPNIEFFEGLVRHSILSEIKNLIR